MSSKQLYKSAESSGLAQKMDKGLIKHYLNLVHVKEDVMALHGMPKELLNSSFAALKKDITAIQGVPIDQVASSFIEVERWARDNRASFASSASSSSAHSIFSHTSRPNSFASVITQYSDDVRSHGIVRFFCPSCPKSCGRTNDLLEHMRDYCEKVNLTRYKCHNCQHEAEREIDMNGPEGHCTLARRRDPQHGLGFAKYDVPVKIGLGCPHCSAYIQIPGAHAYDHRLATYHSHVVQHARHAATTGPGSHSKRVRASIRDDIIIATTDGPRSVAQVVALYCQRNRLPPDAWQYFEWDDVNAMWFWDRLEHGQFDEADPKRETGFWDVDEFFNGLVRRAQHSMLEYHTRQALLADLQQSTGSASSALPATATALPSGHPATLSQSAGPSSRATVKMIPDPTPVEHLTSAPRHHTADWNTGTWSAVVVAPSTASASFKKRKRGPSDGSRHLLTTTSQPGRYNTDKPLPPTPPRVRCAACRAE
ncbi:hypothetical protein LTR53_008783 [Teratosphaeriaceae sp. CCFEE 6253]|nr:hypothetical protein LTR53_008783 [Teratosphaeriaceae sp. CCFEE 6253]